MQITFDLNAMRDEAVIALGNALSAMIDDDINESRRALYNRQLSAVMTELEMARAIVVSDHVKCPETI